MNVAPQTRPDRALPQVNLQVEVLDSVADWDAIGDDWERLTASHPLHGRAWLQAWWQAIGSNSGQLAILVVRHEQTLVGIAPFFVTHDWSGRTLRFLGSGVTCTDYLEIFHLPGWSTQVGRVLAAWLQSPTCHQRWGRVELIELEGHVANAPGVAALQDALAQAGWSEELVALESCWVVPLPKQWDAYVAGLNHRGRRRARQAVRLREQGRVQLEVLRSPAEVERHWTDFIRLHQSRRHDKGEAGCFADKSFEQFLELAVHRLAQQNQVALVGLVHEQQWIAAALQLLGPEHRHLYQTGMDSQFIKLEPGHVINALMLQQTLGEGGTTFDFLRGNEPYKARWNAEPTPLVRTRLWNPCLSALVRSQLAAAGRRMKKWLKRTPPLPVKEAE
jgi:CelD/BcsL family acetyltransferase involved in cellulose biosynthesis